MKRSSVKTTLPMKTLPEILRNGASFDIHDVLATDWQIVS
jgi:hypothetical protein